VGNPNPLSATLRHLRTQAGLSGAEAARRAGLSQSKVSRAENGKFLPTEDDVEALCRVYQAAPDARRELLEMTRELRESSTSARVVLQRGGWWMQQRIGKLEAAASGIREFAPALVLGLLQTESYIDALLGESLAGEDRRRMISSRIERQRILDTDREFAFVMGEGALRWNMGGATVMVEQLDRLVRESRRPNVRLGIIEWTTPATVPALHGFTIYDSRAVLLGTQTATAIVTDQRDVQDYEDHWAELEPIVSYNDAARAAIERVAADYRSIT
jgi:transcriptional regulator with XRE-family HTH domain